LDPSSIDFFALSVASLQWKAEFDVLRAQLIVSAREQFENSQMWCIEREERRRLETIRRQSLLCLSKALDYFEYMEYHGFFHLDYSRNTYPRSVCKIHLNNLRCRFSFHGPCQFLHLTHEENLVRFTALAHDMNDRLMDAERLQSDCAPMLRRYQEQQLPLHSFLSPWVLQQRQYDSSNCSTGSNHGTLAQLAASFFSNQPRNPLMIPRSSGGSGSSSSGGSSSSSSSSRP